MKKNRKRKIDNPVWCILHALYLLRYIIGWGIFAAAMLWSYYSWLAGINGSLW